MSINTKSNNKYLLWNTFTVFLCVRIPFRRISPLALLWSGSVPAPTIVTLGPVNAGRYLGITFFLWTIQRKLLLPSYSSGEYSFSTFVHPREKLTSPSPPPTTGYICRRVIFPDNTHRDKLIQVNARMRPCKHVILKPFYFSVINVHILSRHFRHHKYTK